MTTYTVFIDGSVEDGECDLVLDSCYAGGRTRGNLVMRSIDGESRED